MFKKQKYKITSNISKINRILQFLFFINRDIYIQNFFYHTLHKMRCKNLKYLIFVLLSTVYLWPWPGQPSRGAYPGENVNCFNLEFTSLSALERSEECPNGRSCFQNTTLHSGSRGDINRIQIISLGSTFSRARLRDGQTINHLQTQT